MLFRFQQQDVSSMLTGQLQETFIKRRQDETFAHSQSEQVCVRNLSVAMQTLRHEFCNAAPISGKRVEMMARLILQAFQACAGLVHAKSAGRWVGKKPHQTSLGKGTQSPLQVRRVKPVDGYLIVRVGLIENGQNDI